MKGIFVKSLLKDKWSFLWHFRDCFFTIYIGSVFAWLLLSFKTRDWQDFFLSEPDLVWKVKCRYLHNETNWYNQLMYSLLREKASNHESALLKFAAQLISIPSYGFEEDEVAREVLQTMETLNYDRVFKDSIGNAVGCMFGRNFSPTLLLISHMDTYQTCFQDSCKVKFQDDCLYGRGASDCKSGLAAQIYAGRLLKECFPMYGNLIVVGTVAEQNGCGIGVRHFLKETLPALGLQPSFAILGEPTDLGLYYGHDGWISIELIIASSKEKKLKAAAAELYTFLHKTSFPFLSLGHKTEDVTISEPEYGVLDREKIAKLQITHRLRTLNEPVLLLHRYRETARFICKSHGVRVRSAGIPRRSVKGKDGVEVKIRQLSLPWMTDPMNPFFEEARLALRTANCTVRGGIWSLNRLGRGTAGNILLDTYSIPTIGYGPGKTMTAHEQDECVEVSSIKEAFFGTSVIAHRLLGVSSPGVINKENKNHQ